MSVIDSETETTLARFPINYPDIEGGTTFVPWTVSFSLLYNKAYVIGSSTTDPARRALLSILDGSDFTILRQFSPLSTITNSGSRIAMVYNPLSDKLYCALFSGEIVILDGKTDAILRRHMVRGATFTLALNPTRNKIYIANYESGEVHVIDGESDNLECAITGLSGPYGLGFNARSNRLFTLDLGIFGAERLVAIDGSTDTLVGDCPVGPYPPFIIDNDGALIAADDQSGQTYYAILPASGGGSIGIVLP